MLEYTDDIITIVKKVNCFIAFVYKTKALFFIIFII